MELAVKRPRELGQALRRIRQARKMTQDDLASTVGASRRWVIMTEAGSNPGVQFSMVADALQALGATLVIHTDGVHHD